jgi:hypothetical protein
MIIGCGIVTYDSELVATTRLCRALPHTPSMQTQSKLQSFFSSGRNVIFRRRASKIVSSNHSTNHSAKPQPSIPPGSDVPPVRQSPSSLSSGKINLQTVSRSAGGQGDVNHEPMDVPQNDVEGVVCEHSSTAGSLSVLILSL